MPTELSGRQVPNLSRALCVMESLWLVEIKSNVREIEPIAQSTNFLVVLNLAQGKQE
ncbi:hypothetical protein [Sulfuriferula nivalis]|uniref:Uncharacterized protein n=1 Tax=Sulfuriferula nivalis TaxID=2675298 RepID=A0A809RCB0_9PROT|nr:hypothetical protein [Sulfuriferula nivalis]BBO99295.1 hypothetical protein SFSGTM_00040 [Sulfuriferula nivalis]